MTRHSPIKRRRKPRRGPADIPAECWRNPEYRRYLREDGRCVVCVAISERRFLVSCTPEEANVCARYFANLPCDPAHTEHGGTSQKGRDSSCIPLCRVHHDQADGKSPLPNHANGKPRARNHAAFEEFYGVDLKAEAAKWWAAFQERN